MKKIYDLVFDAEMTKDINKVVNELRDFLGENNVTHNLFTDPAYNRTNEYTLGDIKAIEISALGINKEDIKASFTDGVLEVSIPAYDEFSWLAVRGTGEQKSNTINYATKLDIRRDIGSEYQLTESSLSNGILKLLFTKKEIKKQKIDIK